MRTRRLPVRLEDLDVVDAVQPRGESGDVVRARLGGQGLVGHGTEKSPGEQPTSPLGHVGDDPAGAVAVNPFHTHCHNLDAVTSRGLSRGRIVPERQSTARPCAVGSINGVARYGFQNAGSRPGPGSDVPIDRLTSASPALRGEVSRSASSSEARSSGGPLTGAVFPSEGGAGSAPPHDKQRVIPGGEGVAAGRMPQRRTVPLCWSSRTSRPGGRGTLDRH